MKNVYDMKNIHNNDVNDMSVWNLPHDILNLYKQQKNVNTCYSPILHGSINTRIDRDKILRK